MTLQIKTIQCDGDGQSKKSGEQKLQQLKKEKTEEEKKAQRTQQGHMKVN